MDLTSRELASLFWIGVAFVGAMAVPGVRTHVPGLLRADSAWRLAVGYMLLMAYTVAFVVIGLRAHLWSWELLKPTILWFLTVALVMFFGLNKAMESPAFFRQAALRTIEIPVFLQFIADLFPLGSTTKGLPEPHGIQMRVTGGGHRWYAWRTLPSGWVLGIGASGPPPSQGYYDAPIPPSGPPKDEQTGWFDSLAIHPRPTHWP